MQVKSESSRVGIIHNPSDAENDGYPLSIVIEAILNTDSYITPAIVNVIKSILSDVEDYDEITNIDHVVKLAAPIKVGSIQ